MLRYAITDRLRAGGDASTWTASLRAQAARLAGQGVDFLQVREKDLPLADAVALALHLQQVSTHAGLRILVNVSRADDARAVGATGLGVHLSSTALQELSAETGRTPVADLVSAACHTVQEALLARRLAHLLLFAPVFEKQVRGEHVRHGSGLALLAEVCRAVSPVPVLAMGGVSPLNAEACLQHGAAGIAGIRLFLP